MAEKIETYVVHVLVLEGRHYIWNNMDSVVVAKIKNLKKTTGMQENTDCPFYDELLIFDFEMTLEQFFELNLSVEVLQPWGICRHRKTLGSVSIDIPTIWSQPGHQFYHKWAILSAAAEEGSTGPRGYLKLDIYIVSKGESPEFPPDVVNDDIEGNLLLPEGIFQERQRAKFTFNIFKCENVGSSTSVFNASTLVQIHFAGKKVKTTAVRGFSNPIFNEKLMLYELFPPLCQNIKIELFHGPIHGHPVASSHINLRAISNDHEDGFLPTFGPAPLHFYSLNHLEGYVGTLFLEIDIELLDELYVQEKFIDIPKSINGQEVNNFPNEDLYLMAILFNATLINRKISEKPIVFNLTFGPYPFNESICETEAYSSVHINKSYSHIQFGTSKPFLSLKAKFPDFRKRMYNSNMLSKIVEHIRDQLEEIKIITQNRGYRTNFDIDNIVKQTLEYIKTNGKIYLDIISNYNIPNPTDLDIERMKLCKRIMIKVVNSTDTIDLNMKKRNILLRLGKILKKLELLTEEAQGTWPNVYMWLSSGGKKVGYVEISARDIVYSVVDEEKGSSCGKYKTYYFKSKTIPQKEMVCRIEAIFWLGLERHKDSSFQSVPSCFSINPNDLEKGIITTKDAFLFECRAHIYQARIEPGLDPSGLCDPFAEIFIADQCHKTSVIKNTLSPIWDETLIIKNIILYGSTSFLKSQPPVVFLEMLDLDPFGTDLVGRCEVRPAVILHGENKRATPKLEWCVLKDLRNDVGDVLLAVELVEQSQLMDSNKIDDQKAITSIPDNIKPQKASYRVEIMFWGVRDLKTVGLVKINKPKIVVFIGEKVLESEILANAKSDLNFRDPHKTCDIQLPTPIEYAPPLYFKMLDNRYFGVNIYAGVFISKITIFLYDPITKQFRDQQLRFPSIEVTNQGVQTREETVQKRKFDITFICKKIGFYIKNCLTCRHISKSNSSHHSIKSKHHFKDKMQQSKEKQKLKFIKPKESKSKVKTKSTETKKKCICLKSIWWCLKCLTKTIRCWLKCMWSGIKCCFKVSKSFVKCICCKFECRKKKIDEKVEKSDEPKKRSFLCRWCFKKNKKELDIENLLVEEDYFDWWTKFFASTDIEAGECSIETLNKIKVYTSELEFQPEFEGFQDILKSFPIYRGKRTGDDMVDEEHITGVLKGSVKIYNWPLNNDGDYITTTGFPLKDGIFQDYPPNTTIKCVVRVYCIRGIGLRPKDLNGKSDPYLYLTLNKQQFNDKENYIAGSLDPVFGKLFEFHAVFPRDHTLKIAVWDWDRFTQDDLIGETVIDLENRFYTKYRAHCGIAEKYFSKGYCAWRDRTLPTAILEGLCTKLKLDQPVYSATSVQIGAKLFSPTNLPEGGDSNNNRQVLALYALRHWEQMPVVGFHLVPEHVETRSLYSPKKIGIEQGKLQLWIDIFQETELGIPNPVNIAPRKPAEYELRVIIWNTDEMKLVDDDFFAGEKKSDLYVLGWLADSDEHQCTDVHYRSLTGEGNFNWRFIFPFNYIPSERKVVLHKKAIFTAEKILKVPCKLNIQVWDNDTFTADDFLGTLVLELPRLLRPAKAKNKCNLKMLEPHSPRTNLFKLKRTKGWWPLISYDEDQKKNVIAGKIEMELELLTKEDAEKSPAGLGRKDPQKLPEPDRPDSSFSWFSSPWKGLKYLICHRYKWSIITFVFIFLVVLMGAMALYSFPGYFVKKILAA